MAQREANYLQSMLRIEVLLKPQALHFAAILDRFDERSVQRWLFPVSPFEMDQDAPTGYWLDRRDTTT